MMDVLKALALGLPIRPPRQDPAADAMTAEDVALQARLMERYAPMMGTPPMPAVGQVPEEVGILNSQGMNKTASIWNHPYRPTINPVPLLQGPATVHSTTGGATRDYEQNQLRGIPGPQAPNIDLMALLALMASGEGVVR